MSTATISRPVSDPKKVRHAEPVDENIVDEDVSVDNILKETGIASEAPFVAAWKEYCHTNRLASKARKDLLLMLAGQVGVGAHELGKVLSESLKQAGVVIVEKTGEVRDGTAKAVRNGAETFKESFAAGFKTGKKFGKKTTDVVGSGVKATSKAVHVVDNTLASDPVVRTAMVAGGTTAFLLGLKWGRSEVAIPGAACAALGVAWEIRAAGLRTERIDVAAPI